MKITSKVIFAGALLSAAPAMADDMPERCKAEISYTGQLLDYLYRETHGGGSEIKSPIELNLDLKNYPVSNIKVLKECGAAEEPDTDIKPPLPKSMCQIAGGFVGAYQADVAAVHHHIYSGAGYTDPTVPIATVVVIDYNRGGCRVFSVKEIEPKN